jgi:hypothetical protein
MPTAFPPLLSRRLFLVLAAPLVSSCTRPRGFRYRFRRGETLRYALEIRAAAPPAPGQPSPSTLQIRQILRVDVPEVAADGTARLQLTYERIQGAQDARPMPLDPVQGKLLELRVRPAGRIMQIDGLASVIAAGLPVGFDAARIFQAAMPVFPQQRPGVQAKWGGRASLQLVGQGTVAVLSNHTFEHYEEGSGNQVIHIISNVTVPIERVVRAGDQQETWRGQQYLETHSGFHIPQGRLLGSQGRGGVRLIDPAGQRQMGAAMEFDLALQQQ